MACGCQGAKWTPPTKAEMAAADAARQAARAAGGSVASVLRGPRAPGYTWNGPQPGKA